jgi:uncharacterized protein (TIGR03000 family)
MYGIILATALTAGTTAPECGGVWVSPPGCSSVVWTGPPVVVSSPAPYRVVTYSRPIVSYGVPVVPCGRVPSPLPGGIWPSPFPPKMIQADRVPKTLEEKKEKLPAPKEIEKKEKDSNTKEIEKKEKDSNTKEIEKKEPKDKKPIDDEVRSLLSASVLVRAPMEVGVMANGVAMPRQGPAEVFLTPALEPGMSYVYTFKAEWKRGDEVLTQTRRVVVRAGQRAEVDFRDLVEATREPFRVSVVVPAGR